MLVAKLRIFVLHLEIAIVLLIASPRPDALFNSLLELRGLVVNSATDIPWQ